MMAFFLSVSASFSTTFLCLNGDEQPGLLRFPADDESEGKFY